MRPSLRPPEQGDGLRIRPSGETLSAAKHQAVLGEVQECQRGSPRLAGSAESQHRSARLGRTVSLGCSVHRDNNHLHNSIILTTSLAMQSSGHAAFCLASCIVDCALFGVSTTVAFLRETVILTKVPQERTQSMRITSFYCRNSWHT